MNNKLTISYKKGSIKEYQKRMIAELEPPIFIPMSFVTDGEAEKVIYDCDGFMPLSLFSELLTAGRAFSYLEMIVLALIASREYLLDPEKIAINKTTVYINMKKNKVKLLFVPTTDAISTVNEKLCEFISEIEKGYISQNLKDYLEELKTHLYQGIGTYELMNRISKIKREIYLSGIS